jgi:hypothetical protein
VCCALKNISFNFVKTLHVVAHYNASVVVVNTAVVCMHLALVPG